MENLNNNLEVDPSQQRLPELALSDDDLLAAAGGLSVTHTTNTDRVIEKDTTVTTFGGVTVRSESTIKSDTTSTSTDWDVKL